MKLNRVGAVLESNICVNDGDCFYDCETCNRARKTLNEYADAEEQGLLIKLPCKVGDKIYWFWCDGEGNPDSDIHEETILYFYYDRGGLGIATKYYDGHIGHYVREGEIVNGVRRIFLTREEAEETLSKQN